MRYYILGVMTPIGANTHTSANLTKLLALAKSYPQGTRFTLKSLGAKEN